MAEIVCTIGTYQVTMMDTAKLFRTGRSQAVRLPKEYRFQGDEVRIRRHGQAVILEPVPGDWNWLDAIAHSLDPDMIESVSERPAPQDRPALDKRFP
jgi:antitoxin VapB